MEEKLQTEIIMKMLKDKVVTIREFADAVGTTDIAMIRYLRGDRTPHKPILANMAMYLGCTVEDIYK